MPSHRGPSFSRLKEVLTQLPQRVPQNDAPDEKSSNITEIGHDEHVGENSVAALQKQDAKNTEAVQHTASRSASGPSSLLARPGKAKPITRPSTFRLAVELQDALKTVAEYNGLNMTDIVAESIWLHIQNFEWPPDSGQLRERVSQLF